MSCTIKWLLITVLAFLGWSLYARSMKLTSWPEHQWCYLSFLLGTCKGPAASRPRCQWGVLQAPLCSPVTHIPCGRSLTPVLLTDTRGTTCNAGGKCCQPPPWRGWLCHKVLRSVHLCLQRK